MFRCLSLSPTYLHLFVKTVHTDKGQPGRSRVSCTFPPPPPTFRSGRVVCHRQATLEGEKAKTCSREQAANLSRKYAYLLPGLSCPTFERKSGAKTPCIAYPTRALSLPGRTEVVDDGIQLGCVRICVRTATLMVSHSTWVCSDILSCGLWCRNLSLLRGCVCDPEHISMSEFRVVARS